MSVGLMLSICFIKTMEYQLIKKRWLRLVEPVQKQVSKSGSEDAKMTSIDKEMNRIADITSTAHLPMADDASIYFSALDLSFDDSCME